MGNRLAFTTIEIRRVGVAGAGDGKDGKGGGEDVVVCSGTHTKYMNQ